MQSSSADFCPSFTEAVQMYFVMSLDYDRAMLNVLTAFNVKIPFLLGPCGLVPNNYYCHYVLREPRPFCRTC